MGKGTLREVPDSSIFVLGEVERLDLRHNLIKSRLTLYWRVLQHMSYSVADVRPCELWRGLVDFFQGVDRRVSATASILKYPAEISMFQRRKKLELVFRHVEYFPLEIKRRLHIVADTYAFQLF